MSKPVSEPADNSTGAALFERALRVLPGGVSRNTVLSKPHPIYADRAEGCRVTDIEGETRIDFANNMAALIHGHAFGPVVEAVTAQLSRGTAYTMATEVEIRYAEHLCGRSPNFDQLRFVNSGTEAVMGALKTARAFTGRPKVAKVEGAYHGSYDYAEVSQTAAPETWGSLEAPSSVPVAHGTPSSVLDDVVVLPFNDPDRALAILDGHRGEVACVLVDLMPHRAGLHPATQEFAEALAGWARADGALLVCDEVITFRTRWGGAQEVYGLQPDITALGKIIGGGFPAGAIAGRREVMSVMDPSGPNYRLPYSGTFSANPVTMTAGLVAMEHFDRAEVERVNGLAAHARAGIERAIQDHGFDASVCGMGSMLRVHLQAEAPRSYRDGYLGAEATQRLQHFIRLQLGQGIMPIYSGALAFSTAMTIEEANHLITATTAALHELERPSDDG